MENSNHSSIPNKDDMFVDKINMYNIGISADDADNANDMMDDARNNTFYGSNIINKPFLNNIFFNVKNNTFEVVVMWCLLIVTIILLLSLLLKNANDEEETLRILLSNGQ